MAPPLCESGQRAMSPAGEYAWRARFETGVDDDAPVDRETGRLGRPGARAHAQARDDEIGLKDASARKPYLSSFQSARRVPKMEDDAMLLMQSANEIAHLGPQNALHRTFFRRHDVDFDVPGAERSRDFEPDEAGAEHDRPPRRPGAIDDRPAVRERAQHENVGRLCARNGWAHRFGARRQKKTIEGNCVAVGERNFPRANVDAGDGRLETKVNSVVGIEAHRAEREPVLRRAAGEIVLGKVRPVDRRGFVAAQHDDLALVLPPPEHLRGSEARGAAADNGDPAGLS